MRKKLPDPLDTRLIEEIPRVFYRALTMSINIYRKGVFRICRDEGGKLLVLDDERAYRLGDDSRETFLQPHRMPSDQMKLVSEGAYVLMTLEDEVDGGERTDYMELRDISGRCRALRLPTGLPEPVMI